MAVCLPDWRDLCIQSQRLLQRRQAKASKVSCACSLHVVDRWWHSQMPLFVPQRSKFSGLQFACHGQSAGIAIMARHNGPSPKSIILQEPEMPVSCMHRRLLQQVLCHRRYHHRWNGDCGRLRLREPARGRPFCRGDGPHGGAGGVEPLQHQDHRYSQAAPSRSCSICLILLKQQPALSAALPDPAGDAAAGPNAVKHESNLTC